MKKLSFFLAVVLVLSLMTAFATVGSAAGAPADNGKIAITGSTISNADVTNGDVSVDGNGVIKLTRTAASGEIKLEVNNDNEKAIMAAADSEFLQFKLDISEYSPNEELHPYVYTRDSSYNYHDNWGVIRYQLYIDNEWEEWKTNDYGWFIIPAGFNGYVRLHMSSLGNVDYKTNGFACFAFSVSDNPLGGTGKSIYFSDFALVKGAGLGYTVPTQEAAPKDGGKVAFLSGSNCTLNPVMGGEQKLFVAESGSNKMIRIKSKTAGAIFGFDSGTMTAVDASGMEYLQMWVDASDITDKAGNGISLRVFDADGAVADIYGANDNTDYYLLVNKVWEKHTVSGNACAIPAGYKGYIRVDMSQFKSASAGYIGNGNPVNMAKISGIWVWFQGSTEAVGNAAYVNDICFVKALAVDVPAEDAVLADIYADGGYYGASYAEASKGELVFMTAFDMTVLNSKASDITKIGMYVYSSANTVNKEKWFTAEATLDELGEKDGKLAVMVSDIASDNFNDEACAVPYILFENGTLLTGTGDRAAAVSVSDFNTQCLGK